MIQKGLEYRQTCREGRREGGKKGREEGRRRPEGREGSSRLLISL
jgi:hypothetical protein